MPTAEEVEDNLGRRRTEKLEECGSLGMWWNSTWRKKAPAARSAHPSAGHMEFLGISCSECRSKYCADEDHSDQLRRKNREDRRDALGIKVVKIVMTGSSRVRTTKTCRRLEKTDGTTKVDRSNKFDVLNPTKTDWRLRR